MSVAAPISWEAWRASYDDMTFADQQEFYEQVREVAPVQRQHSVEDLSMLLVQIAEDEPLDIIELGGWDGEYADRMMSQWPSTIASWTNFEICGSAVNPGVCARAGYQGVALEDFYWEQRHVCDLFVASHVIEHLRFADVLKVFAATVCTWMYLQAPLQNGGRSWQGYHGSHILEVGWDQIRSALAERGFGLIDGLSRPGVQCFERQP